MEHSCFLCCSSSANMLDWPALPSMIGEMRSNGTFLFSRLFLTYEHTPLARTSQHRFGAGVFSVSAKKGAIIYPEGFFQRPGKC